MAQPIPLGPWPLGVDNVHAPSHRVFQVPGQGQPPARLRGAIDVDLDDEGWPAARAGLTPVDETLEFTAGERLLVAGGQMFTQIDGTLALDGDALVADLERPISVVEWPAGSGRLWGTDGVVNFQLRDGVLKEWGLATPTPVITGLEEGSTGTLRDGAYLVSTTLRTTQQESGAVSPIVVELAAEGDGGFTITQAVTDANATHVAFYVSAVGGSEPTLVSILPIVEDPDDHTWAAVLVVDDPDQLGTTRIPLSTMNASPPPTGITVVGSVQAFVLVAVGNALYRARAGQPWLFDLHTAIQMFPADITTIVGLQSGAWVGTEAGLFWVTGDSPENWRRVKVADDPVIPEGLAVPGGAIPALQADGLVALMATPTGLVAGLPDGSLRRLTQDRYHFPTATRVSMVYAAGSRRFFVAVV